MSKKFRTSLDKAKLLIKTQITITGQQKHLYSFHTLRHTYAAYLLEKDVDLYYIQRSLGHSEIYTTQICAYVSQKALKEKIDTAFRGQKRENTASISDPFDCLKIRFANSKISIDEFKEKYEILNNLQKETLFG